MVNYDEINTISPEDNIMDKKIPVMNEKRVKKYILAIYFGSALFIIAGFLNLVDEYFKGWSQRIPVIGYILFAFTACSLIPIAIGIQKITKDSFQYQATKAGKASSIWLITYGIAIVADIIFFGWIMIATITLLLILFSRVLGFYYLKKVFDKIKFYTEFNISSWAYLAYGCYYLILSLFGGLAALVSDDIITNMIFIFNGIGESIFIVAIGIKLIVDFTLLRKFILTGYVRKRRRRDVNYFEQALKREERLEEKAVDDYELIEKRRYKKEPRVKITNNSLIIGLEAILVFLIGIACITRNSALGVFSAIIFTSILIYSLALFSIKILQRKEKIIDAKFTSYFLLFILLPIVFLLSNFGVLEVTNIFLEFDFSMKVILTIATTLVLEILIIREILRSKLNINNFSFREFISLRMIKESNSSKTNRNTVRLQRKHSNFNNLDVIAARIAEKQKDRSIDIDEFDWKERVNKI